MSRQFFNLFLILTVAAGIRFGLLPALSTDFPIGIKLSICLLILIAGAVLVLKRAADIIEGTTEVLSLRTQVASGLLQAIGTAFPDMVLGIVAALISLEIRKTDQIGAVNYAIIAAATTFGSNIYNIGHAAWCIWRQNLANKLRHTLQMFPGWDGGGKLTPISQQKIKPHLTEIDQSLDVLVALTLLTTTVAISMVVFGKSSLSHLQFEGDLYQLIQPVGVVIAILCVFILFHFRRSQHIQPATTPIISHHTNVFHQFPTWLIVVKLLAAGLGILLAAESMVRAIETFCLLTGVPIVIAGVISGIIGCLGEMIVVHNFSVNPNGRLGDAVTGVAMDNIVTTLGAAIVAIIGGIFLGGNALILIFVVILSLNAILIWQLAKLKNAWVKIKLEKIT